VEHEVVGDGDEPRQHGGDVVVDPDRVHAQGVDGDVDDEADAAHDAEAHQLQPVGRPAHPVKEADVRLDLDGCWGGAGEDVRGASRSANSARAPGAAGSHAPAAASAPAAVHAREAANLVRDPEEANSFPAPASVKHSRAATPARAGEAVVAAGAPSDAEVRAELK